MSDIMMETIINSVEVWQFGNCPPIPPKHPLRCHT
jgi:hypothetical protein